MKLQELDQDVVRRLDSAFLAGDGSVDVDELLIDSPAAVDLQEARAVIDEAMKRFASNDAKSDAWIGPRLHAALRLTRRQAARKGIWRFLGVVAFPDYVRWRWTKIGDEKAEPPALERFVGPDYKQALARLWWMVELFRDGPDYGPAARALENQDIINTLLRMDIAHHRPTALGVVAALEGAGENGGTGREAVALSKAANVAATTLVVDLIAPDEPLDDAARETWIGEEHDASLFFDDLPEGPDDPPVSDGSLAAMTDLAGELLAEAPVRGKS